MTSLTVFHLCMWRRMTSLTEFSIYVCDVVWHHWQSFPFMYVTSYDITDRIFHLCMWRRMTSLTGFSIYVRDVVWHHWQSFPFMYVTSYDNLLEFQHFVYPLVEQIFFSLMFLVCWDPLWGHSGEELERQYKFLGSEGVKMARTFQRLPD